MFVVHPGTVVLVTVEAGEGGEIVGCRVARLAAVPSASMRARENGKGSRVVIGERSACPGIVRVARATRGREACSTMLALVITLVTRNAVVLAGRVEDGVTGAAAVATRAPDLHMPAEEGESTRGRHMVEGDIVGPRQSVVTLLAFGGESCGHMVYRLGCRVVRRVA